MPSSFRYTPVVLLSLLGLAVTLGLFIYAKQSEELENRQRFEKDAGRFIEMLERDLNAQQQGLESVALFFGASELVDRFSFYTLVMPLYKRFSSFQSIQWVPVVPQNERWRYESFAQHDGFPDFHFLEKNTEDQIVIAQTRKNFYPIFYIEPYKNHENVLGLDLASDTLWFETIQQALNNKRPYLSKIKTVHAPSIESPRALMLVPIINARGRFNSSQSTQSDVMGLIVGQLRIDQLINNQVFKLRHSEASLENFQIQLFEVNEHETQQLILTKSYTRTASVTDSSQQATLQRFAKSIQFGSRGWHIVIMNDNPREKIRTLTQASRITLFSLSFFTLLAMYLIRIIRDKNKTQELMRTQAQLISDTKQKLMDVLDCMGEGFICFNQEGTILAANQKAEHIFAYSRSEMLDQPITWLLPNLQQNFIKIPFKAAADENTPHQHIDGVNKAGALLTLDATFSKVGSIDKALYLCVFQDVSEKNQVAQARAHALTHLTQEIKTPLTTIKGAIDFITANEEAPLSDKNQRMLEMIKNNNERLAELINELIHTLK